MRMEEIEKIKIGVLLGPTASGKTACAIQAAGRLNAEIISADSIQVYRGMSIGSAKPTKEEMRGIPHHLLDVADPDKGDFSVAMFQRFAAACIRDIHARGKFPLVVGGTGLYINALTYPLAFLAVPGNPEIRQALEREEEAAPGSAYTRLKEVDPVSASRLHENDRKRAIRALEVYLSSGRTMSSFGTDFANESNREAPYDPVIVGLSMERELLYARINRRVDMMLQAGLVDEARALYDAGLPVTLPAIQGLGYRQLYRYFDGDCTLLEAAEAIKQQTRHFAKRQMTWFRRDGRIQWIPVTENSDAAALGAKIAMIMEGKDGNE